MLQPPQVEELMCLVASMDRRTLMRQFVSFRAGNFPVDFTPQFLEQLSVERLRHIYVALCLQCQHVPDMAEATAA